MEVLPSLPTTSVLSLFLLQSPASSLNISLSNKIESLDLTQSQASTVAIDNDRHYRGGRRWPWGKFTTKIKDMNKRGARVWLGTFDTAIDAAHAYDRAVFKLKGSKAIINFSLEIADLCSVGSNIDCGRKRRSVEEDRVEIEPLEKMVNGMAMEAEVVVLVNEKMSFWDKTEVRVIFDIPLL